MKTIISIAAMVLIFSNLVLAEAPDTTKLKFGKTRVLIIEESDSLASDTLIHDTLQVSFDTIPDKPKFNGHWAGLELGLNNYFNSAGSLTLSGSDEFLQLNPGKSLCFSLNFAEFNLGLYKDYIGITTGLGLEVNNYRFDSDITLNPSSDVLSFSTDSSIKIMKNKLLVSYLTVPLLFEFQLPYGPDDDQRFSLGIGGYGSVRIGSHTKQVFRSNNIEFKDKIHDSYNLNPLKYGITARIGIEDIQLFVNYSLSSLFESSKGPELYPVSVGITLLNL